jgi:N-acyl-D-aspartate/D-glutamate deacylase
MIDGTGAPGRQDDVAIIGERIVATGVIDGDAHETIDATGMVLTPGFVDIHTHYDGQVSWDSELAPSSINGVTSVAMGNCGVGFAPARPGHHGRLIELLEGVEDIPGTALHEGLTWDWESFPQYLDALARRRFTMDVGAHLPHAALRIYVMGERGIDCREVPTSAELEQMGQLATEAMAAGALGITTSRTIVHRAKTGELIGTLEAAEAELRVLAHAMRDAKAGVFQLITDAYMKGDDAFVDAEFSLIEMIARESGRPVSFSLMQTKAMPDRWQHLLDRAGALSRLGHDVRVQVSTRAVGVIIGFATTLNPFMTTPSFLALAKLPLTDRLEQLARPAVRAAILTEYRSMPHDGPSAQIELGFDGMFRMADPVDYEPDPETSIGAAARRQRLDPAEFAYNVLLEEGGTRLLYFPVINYSDGNLDAVHAMMVSERALFGLSDGGAHCGTICDASFPTTTIDLWRRGNRNGLSIPLEQLVHGYTQRNAAYVGWYDRGVIAPGYLADLNLIDLAALNLPPPRIVQDLPAGGSRLLQYPAGYRMTMKRGAVTMRDGQRTAALPGRLLRGSQGLH